jgi:hypothetical protein
MHAASLSRRISQAHVLPPDSRTSECGDRVVQSTLDGALRNAELRRHRLLGEAREIAKQDGLTPRSSNDEAARRAEAAGLTVIMDKCIGATHRELTIPRR